MEFWEFINRKQKNGQGLILMVVIDNQGSSPGRIGFKMAVSEDGDLEGSIGGGVMEFNLVELAKKQIIKSDGIFIKSQKHSAKNDPDSSGMICSGSQTIAFYPISSDQVSVIENIISVGTGVLKFDENGFSLEDKGVSHQKYKSEIFENKKWLLTEQLGLKNQLYVFGSGHVSIAVSKLFKTLDFEVVVFDNRNEELPTFKSNTYADSKQIINFDDAANYIPDGDNIYVVIMTFSHHHDHKVLHSLIHKKIKYLGMMASKKKQAAIYGLLKETGVSMEQLNQVDSPIGVEIKSQTPAEIAVSIAAKVISVKNK